MKKLLNRIVIGIQILNFRVTLSAQSARILRATFYDTKGIFDIKRRLLGRLSVFSPETAQ